MEKENTSTIFAFASALKSAGRNDLADLVFFWLLDWRRDEIEIIFEESDSIYYSLLTLRSKDESGHLTIPCPLVVGGLRRQLARRARWERKAEHPARQRKDLPEELALLLEEVATLEPVYESMLRRNPF